MTEIITISDDIRIALRRSARARRMTLRVPRSGGEPVLTLPLRVPLREGRAFAEAQADWLRRATARRIAPQIVAAGAVFPVEGRPMRLTQGEHRSMRVIGDALCLPARRPVALTTRAFLRHLAAERLRGHCDRFATELGRDYKAITLRDTRSRWGSCTSEGRLMFSWRLAMAPPRVLEYVAAHETAHLVHMDHSSRFWDLVGALFPDYRTERRWLRDHGSELLAWRFSD